MCRIAAALVALLLSASAARGRTPLPPYDFTGHWTGVIIVGLQVFPVAADLTMHGPKKFSGEAVVSAVACTVRGRRKRKVVLRLRCESGTKGRLAGILDLANDSLAGAGRLRNGVTKASATFAIERSALPVCGNGAREAGEQCDDGNTQDGDGCSAACAVEVSTMLDESEPNGTPGQATEVTTLPALVRGSVAAGGDEDFFRIVLSGSDLLLETFDQNGPGSCSGTDTVIELRGPDGTTVVAVDDDGGLGTCSRVEVHGLTPGVYFPCVRSGAPLGGRVPAYQLLIVGP